MKLAIYISGILGGLAIVLSIIGIFVEFPHNDKLLWVGLILVVGICIPMFRFERYLANRRYKQKKDEREKTEQNSQSSPNRETPAKGWGMNNSPFRDRKSGLTWGGGNVKGVNATRGRRKRFLK